MQQNVSSSKARKEWRVKQQHERTFVGVVVRHKDQFLWGGAFDITGASPAYVEAMIERLNIHINNLLYELGRIPR